MRLRKISVGCLKFQQNGESSFFDKCDVFLAQRTIADLERNKLVSGEMVSILGGN